MTLQSINRQISPTEQILAELSFSGRKKARILCTGLRVGARPITVTIYLSQGSDPRKTIKERLEKLDVKRVRNIQVHPLSD